MTQPRSLDHFVDAVYDVDLAAAQYQRLGFHVLPKMRHVEIGSCNRIIQFNDTYLELAGDLDRCPPSLRDRLTPRFQCGEGLAMTSLTSRDLRGDHETLLSDPTLTVDRILNARRQITMPDSSQDETNSHCFYVWHPRSTFLTLFFSEHYKTHTIWVPAYMRHPNGVQRVVGQAFVAPAPLQELTYFSRLLELAPTLVTPERLVFITARGESIEILAPAGLTNRFGTAAPSPCAAFAGYGVALRYQVADLDTCRQLLAANGVPHRDDGDLLTVAGSNAAGIVTEFVAAAARTPS